MSETDQAWKYSHNWYHAITLAERIESLRKTPHAANPNEAYPDLANRRLHQWRSQPPFTNASWFDQRLALADIREDEFLYVLGEQIESVHHRFPAAPEWLAELTVSLSRSESSRPASPPLPADGQTAAFLEAIEPTINRGRERLQEGIKALAQSQSDLPFDPETVEDLLYPNLPKRLLPMLSRTLVLELNVARLEGVLHGNTSEERFESFLKRLRQPSVMLALLEEYPVLARQLITCIDQWVTFSLAFLQHLLDDWNALRTTFDLKTHPGVLVEVKSSAGD